MEYEIAACDLIFTVELAWDRGGTGDEEIWAENIYLHDEAVDVTGLFVEQKDRTGKTRYTALPYYLEEQAIERLYDEGGPEELDSAAIADFKNDVIREAA